MWWNKLVAFGVNRNVDNLLTVTQWLQGGAMQLNNACNFFFLQNLYTPWKKEMDLHFIICDAIKQNESEV